ncbi:terminase large subunit [Mycobacterium phage Weirdo19]|uniref:Terminase large subunit n=1 Tax=Mycobacterium phage Weirdo19 TaxID=2601610 RepID=A0A6M2YST4_9CAUD|nr:terminase large subunit [Mycobacterium phage Weirdo19]QEA10770.1 terminase large subunit [Mycobacterium phage Weirdo19]
MTTSTSTRPARTRSAVDNDPPPWIGHWPRLDGPQEPRYHSAHPDADTADDRDAIRAAKFAAKVTRSRCMPWQWSEVRGIMLRNAEGLWLHREGCLVDTRQQGKTWIMVIRILFGLFYLGETCVYSAQRGQTADAVFSRIVEIIESRPSLAARLLTKTGGKQGRGDITVRARNGKIATLRCGVRSTDLGRGLDQIDLVIFDEAYNLTEAEVAALAGAQIASPNAQTIYTSTAPVASIHAFCHIFTGVRERGMAGHKDPDEADAELWYSEYCAPPPPKDERERAAARLDRENWRLASPSHGVISKDRDIDALRKTLCINAAGVALWEADFLGWGEWPTTEETREPVIPIEEVWVPLRDPAPVLVGQTVIAVSRTQDRKRWAFAAGRRRVDGAVALELGKFEEMNLGQAARYLLLLVQKFDPPEVIMEGHDKGTDLVPVMRKLGLDIRLTTANEFAIASSAFIDHAFSGDMCHPDQPIIREALEQAAMRTLPKGDEVFDTQEGSIAQLIAYVLALWGVLEFAEEDTPAALPMGGDGGGPVDEFAEFGSTSSTYDIYDLAP